MLHTAKLLSIWLLAIISLPEVCFGQSIDKLTQPALLKPGDTIMFVAPAASLDRDRMMLAKKRLEERGYKVKMRDDLFDGRRLSRRQRPTAGRRVDAGLHRS